MEDDTHAEPKRVMRCIAEFNALIGGEARATPMRYGSLLFCMTQ